MMSTNIIKAMSMAITAGVFLIAPLAFGEVNKDIGTEASQGASIIRALSSSTTTATAEQKPKIKTKQQERLYSIVNERAQILHNRWDALALRLDVVSERISSRISKIKKGGTDTTSAEALLKTANKKIEAARERADEAADKITKRADESNGTARDLRKIENEVINTEKEAVGQAFQEAKDALSDAVNAL